MITKLTKKQEALIPVYIENWINKASEPIDREKAMKIAKELFGEDNTVLIAESIQNAVNIIKYISNSKSIEFSSQIRPQLYSQLGSQLYSQLHSQLHSQLSSQLDSQLYSQFYSQLDSQLNSQLSSQLDSQLYSQLSSQLSSQLHSQIDSQIDSQLYSQLHSQLDSQLHSQLHSQLYSQLDSQLHSQLDSQLGSQLHSQLDSQFGSQKLDYAFYISIWWYPSSGYYDFAEKIGVKFDEKTLAKFNEIILNIPIIINLGKIKIIIEKPKCRWNNKRLHSDEFPAIKWKDKTGIYLINGIKFEKELWEKVVSKKMPFQDILAIKDIDQRTQALKYGNWDDFVKYQEAKKINEFTKFDVNGETVPYELWRFPVHSQKSGKRLFTKEVNFARYICPSTRQWVTKGVPSNLMTISECMAWGMSNEERAISPNEWESLIPLLDES
jgi:hypothetical protein